MPVYPSEYNAATPPSTTPLLLALGMFARDPRSPLTEEEREQIRTRLRATHAMNVPLVLSPVERQRWEGPLLAYLALRRPRLVGSIAAQLRRAAYSSGEEDRV